MMNTSGVKSRHQLTPQQIQGFQYQTSYSSRNFLCWIWDRIFAGFPQIKVSGKAGQQARLYLSETLDCTGEPATRNSRQSLS